MRAGGVAVLLGFGVAIACGGRSSFTPRDEPDGAGGSVSSSGKASAGGKTSTGGKANSAGGNLNLGAVTSFGGTVTSGGSSVCACDPVACRPGYYQLPAPQSCCGGECVLDCRDVGCTDIDLDCQEGMHVGTLPDECCERCVPDNPPPCEVARDLYEQYRAKTIGKYAALGCSPGGCALAGENNRCAISCGIVIPAAGRDFLEEDLGLFAEATCSSCPLPEEPPCLPIPPLTCSGGEECVFTPTQ
jgi:hypothetical protein